MTGTRPWWRRARARRPEELQPEERTAAEALAAPRPVDRHTSVHAAGDEPGLRVLLFGSGPASGWGVREQDHGLGGALARSLAARTGRRATVDFLVDDYWEERDAASALRDQRLAEYDAVVAISAYRQTLLDFPVGAWRAYVDGLRDLLLAESGPDGAVQILALPWHDAALRAPEHWGGAFGRKIVALAAAAADSVLEFERIGLLELSAPADAAEWIGPAFSRGTYDAWGEQSARALVPRLRLSAAEPAPADQP